MPSSSPMCQTKSSERFGCCFADANASAISRTPIEPEPSSSAPLLIESSRAGWSARRLSVIARIFATSSAVAGRFGLSAPCGLTTVLNTRIESWSTAPFARTPT